MSNVFKVVTTPFARKNLVMSVAWMDGRSRAAGTGKAASCDSGGGGAWLTKRAGTSKAGQTGKPTAQIEPRIMYYAIK